MRSARPQRGHKPTTRGLPRVRLDRTRSSPRRLRPGAGATRDGAPGSVGGSTRAAWAPPTSRGPPRSVCCTARCSRPRSRAPSTSTCSARGGETGWVYRANARVRLGARHSASTRRARRTRSRPGTRSSPPSTAAQRRAAPRRLVGGGNRRRRATTYIYAMNAFRQRAATRTYHRDDGQPQVSNILGPPGGLRRLGRASTSRSTTPTTRRPRSWRCPGRDRAAAAGSAAASAGARGELPRRRAAGSSPPPSPPSPPPPSRPRGQRPSAPPSPPPSRRQPRLERVRLGVQHHLHRPDAVCAAVRAAVRIPTVGARGTSSTLRRLRLPDRPSSLYGVHLLDRRRRRPHVLRRCKPSPRAPSLWTGRGTVAPWRPTFRIAATTAPARPGSVAAARAAAARVGLLVAAARLRGLHPAAARHATAQFYGCYFGADIESTVFGNAVHTTFYLRDGVAAAAAWAAAAAAAASVVAAAAAAARRAAARPAAATPLPSSARGGRRQPTASGAAGRVRVGADADRSDHRAAGRQYRRAGFP